MATAQNAPRPFAPFPRARGPVSAPAALPSARVAHLPPLRRPQVLKSRPDSVSPVLPLLAHDTFRLVLTELDVNCIVTDYNNGDAVIATIARNTDCCFVSKGSDFFILESPVGYIPLDELKVTMRGVTARKFSRARFAEHYHMPETLLPLFASLVGNDVVSYDSLKYFHQHVASAFPNPPESNMSQNHAKIQSIAMWVAQFTSEDDALDAALKIIIDGIVEASKAPPADEAAEADGDAADGDAAAAPAAADGDAADADAEPRAPLTEEERMALIVKIKDSLEQSIHQYRPASAEEVRVLLENPDVTTLDRPAENKAGYPAWVVRAYRNGDFNKTIMGVMTSRPVYWCNVLVEDMAAPCVWLVSRDVRRCAYGVIMGDNAGASGKWGEDPSGSTLEFVRDGANFIKEDIKPIFALEQDGEQLPTIAQMDQCPESERRDVLEQILKCSHDVFDDLPEQFALPIAALRYWVQVATPALEAWEVASIVCCMLRNPSYGGRTFRPRHIQMLATWQVLCNCITQLNDVLMRPMQPLQPWVVFDGMFLHTFCNDARRARGGNVVPLLAKAIGQGNIPSFWLLYNAVTKGLEAKISGNVKLDDSEIRKNMPQLSGIEKKPVVFKSRNVFDNLGDEELFEVEEDEISPEEIAKQKEAAAKLEADKLAAQEVAAARKAEKEAKKKAKEEDPDIDALLAAFDDEDAETAAKEAAAKEAKAAKRREKKKKGKK